MIKNIAVLPGDGIGQEVTSQAIKVLEAVALRFNHHFKFSYGLIGAAAIDQTGSPFPDSTLALCKASDAILFGAVGDPKYDLDPSARIRPEQGLLKMRKELGLFANLRPVRSYEATVSKSPLKASVLKGIDVLVFRELTGGIYFGKKTRTDNSASDLCVYTKEEILRIALLAFEAAMKRKKKLTLVDKANVLETSRLWRKVVQELSLNYPEVNTDLMFVDNAAMQIILNPRQFDVILTENMFGDILTDEASVLTGSIGLLPSASIGKEIALYEPIHGSYPQAAGKNMANPIGSILSAAMMLEYSFGLHVESAFIHKAVNEAIESGFVTSDINSNSEIGTADVGNYIARLVYEEMLFAV